MAAKKRFLLRIDPRVHAAMEKWAADELRSVNAQLEYVITEALKRAGRLPRPARERSAEGSAGGEEDDEA